ncbi:MAG: hypothetical protein IVW54_02355 [Candidatus Binataceae bacterium]|nr:hypothetical protein [Candidatus Binataceae bacterium]
MATRSGKSKLSTRKKAAAKKPPREPGARSQTRRIDSQPDLVPADLRDREIYELHRLFLQIMEGDRLLTISNETKGHYLTVMRSLTAKLSVPGKPLSEIISEMMAETAPLIFRLMQS